MLNKYLLYVAYNADSPLAFLDFIVMCYEIPKRAVDSSLTKQQMKHRQKRYDAYFTTHGLAYRRVKLVRDSYVHNVSSLADLIQNVHIMSIHSLYTFVVYHELDITLEDLLLKKNQVLKYLKGVYDIFGEVDFASKRYVPWKED